MLSAPESTSAKPCETVTSRSRACNGRRKSASTTATSSPDSRSIIASAASSDSAHASRYRVRSRFWTRPGSHSIASIDAPAIVAQAGFLSPVPGNTYTYGHLGSISRTYAVPKPTQASPAQLAKSLIMPVLSAPKQPASAGAQPCRRAAV